uniref:Translocase of inner mitochondrial membrane 10 homolog B (yeast) n=1 Tax=Gasterosteus aculeatus aculeatus TaxID=481459 RepID=A0AAQ4QVW5_GASAC
MEPEQQLRNLRDFLLVYNRMTEICFQRCSSNFNYRNLTMDERCADNCAGKLIRSNHRLMGTYVQLMPRMVQRRMEEMESKAAAAEAAAASQTPAAFSQGAPLLERPLTSMANDDAGPQPAGLNVPVELDAAKSTRASEVQLSAAVPPSAAIETAHGPSNAAGAPRPPVAVDRIESESSAPVFTPRKPDVPVATVAAPTESKSSGGRSEVPPPPSGQ